MSAAQPVPDDGRRLEILLKDYELARMDDRSLNTIQGTAFNVIAVVVGVIAAGASSGDRGLPVAILIGAPLVPVAMLAYVLWLGAQATVRSFYMRGLEAELKKYSSAPLTSLKIPPASLVELTTVVISMRRGRRPLLLVTNLIFVVVAIGLGGLIVFIAVERIQENWQRALMGAVYAPIGLLMLWETLMATVRGRSLFQYAADRFVTLDPEKTLPKAGGNARATTHKGERGILSYLFYPRPEEWTKGLFAPIAFGCAAWATGEWGALPAFICLWLTLDLLIYQVRYQLNDVRGIGEDRTHAERRSRSRLPAGSTDEETRRNVLLSLAVAAARIGAALLIGWWTGLLAPVGVLVLLVLVITIPYEFLRGRSAAMAREAARRGRNPLDTTWAVAGVWMTVSLGYALRGGLGVDLGGLALTDPTAILATTSIAVFGTMFVLLTWALEATSYCRHAKDGPTGPGATWYRLPELERKPNVGAMLAFAGKNPVKPGPDVLPEGWIALDDARYCGRYPILRESSRLRTPWNIALMFSGLLAAPLGVRLALMDGPRPLVQAAGVALVAIGVAVLIRARAGWRHGVTIVAVAAALVMLAGFAGSGKPFLAGVPWLAASSLYALCRASSYRDLKVFSPSELAPHIKRLGGSVRLLGQLLVALVLTKETATLLRDARPGSSGQRPSAPTPQAPPPQQQPTPAGGGT
ncbi:hypothetical protein [Actinomadura sp. 3N508]|uniref:hypothetical protein n=1 Tax=Actinomadura sp. 3N508 TaxID=3375153 RepID=UPI0037B005DD